MVQVAVSSVGAVYLSTKPPLYRTPALEISVGRNTPRPPQCGRGNLKMLIVVVDPTNAVGGERNDLTPLQCDKGNRNADNDTGDDSSGASQSEGVAPATVVW
jgi:hypothetical protein